MTNPAPPGYSTASPYLIVRDAAKTIEFLTTILSGQVKQTIADEEGRLRHAEVCLGDTVVMLSDSYPGWSAIEAHVHVYVPDVDETYRRALEAGASSVQAPQQKDDEDKRGGVKDSGGTTWWIASRARVGAAFPRKRVSRRQKLGSASTLNPGCSRPAPI